MHIEQKQDRIYKPQSVTTLSAEESNQVTTELENLITAGSLTPSAGTLTQVRDAVQNVVNVAKNDLQEQIDAITSASDVFDVVGTYADLQAYDTSTVPINDIIKVLQDSTHNNAATYYRLIDESGALTWQYVGQEGPYYTKSEVDLTFATKSELPGVATTQQVGLVKPDGQSVMVAQDGTLSVSSNVAASLPLFTSIWADHILNDTSYLRSDTFSWQSGSVYTSAYNHLVADISGITAETETISGTTITFYRATDGHKIVLADQESNVSAIYTATGVAWYYILDTVNSRFKLPRSKWNFVGLRDNVGNYVEPGLPNIEGSAKGANTNFGILYADAECSGALYKKNANLGVYQAVSSNDGKILGFDASLSNSIYGNSTNVQPPATQSYLYFYVGNTVQDQTTIDVGQITDALNGKVDLANGVNQADVDYVVESYKSGTSWYRVYKSGWCEQGGYLNVDGVTSVSFLQPYIDANITILIGIRTTYGAPLYANTTGVQTFSSTGFTINIMDGNQNKFWEAKGYIS